MRKGILAIAAAALLLPGAAMAQTAGIFTGFATLNPPLKSSPNTGAGGYNFSGNVAGGVGGGAVNEVGGKFQPGSSCGGNVHGGVAETTPSGNGYTYQGVCVAATCIGAGYIGTSGAASYQLVFTAGTVQAAMADCGDAPAGSGKGLSRADFNPGGWIGR